MLSCRLLQTQLEKTEKELKKKEKQWAADLGELRRDNDRQQKVIAQVTTSNTQRVLIFYNRCICFECTMFLNVFFGTFFL